MNEPKKLKVIFAPGFFDHLPPGLTEAERAELVAEVTRLAESGELLEQGRPLDPDDPEDAEALEAIERALSGAGPEHQ